MATTLNNSPFKAQLADQSLKGSRAGPVVSRQSMSQFTCTLTSQPSVRLQKNHMKQSQGLSQRLRMSQKVTEAVLGAHDSAPTPEKNTSNLNPTESLLELFAKLPLSSEVSETESADRLLLWEDVPKLAEKQTFSVYELNEFDRDSPAVLEFSRQTVNKIDSRTGGHIHALGDQVSFTNKLYNGSLKTRLGITAGICLLMKTHPGKGTAEMHQLVGFTPDYYETIMSWHFGDMGHICGMGPFINFEDTLLAVTGGTGFFREARGVIRLHNLTPFKFFYTFTLMGIPELPKVLTGEVVPPAIHVQSHPDALACKPGFTLPNYNN